MNTWFVGVLVAIAPLDEVRISTPDGGEVKGVVSAIKPGALVVHEGEGKHTRVELNQMSEVELEGEAIAIHSLGLEIDQYIEERYGAVDQPQPSPGAVVLASVVLPGAGHRLLGDNQTFAAYAVADLIALGLAAAIIWDRQRFAEGLPLLALDATFRVYSAAEARKEARIRREILSRRGHSRSDPTF